MQPIISTLSKLSLLEDGCQLALERAFVPFECAEDTHLLRPGEVQARIYFLEEGVLMNHYLADTHQLINWLAPPSDFAASVESFHHQRPSLEYLTACTHVSGAYLSKKDYEKLLLRFPSLNVLTRRVLIYHLVQAQRRVHDLAFLDTYTRYCNLMAERPDLLRQLPNKLLARYLHMTESTFSKMRKKYWAENKR